MPTDEKQVGALAGKRETERLIAKVVREILLHPASGESVLDQALAAGYSRSHWSRLFASMIGEPPAAFLRRIRMERACSLLSTTDMSVQEIGLDSGYDDPSAFGRAFRRVIGRSPLDFRADPVTISVPDGGIHWVRVWDEIEGEEVVRMNRRFPLLFQYRPSVRLAVVERFGSYAFIGEYLADLMDLLERDGIGAEGRTFYTIYYDSLWTHPSCHGMRAHLGFVLGPSEVLPAGFDEVVLRAGTYATFESAIARTERNDGWAWMSRNHFGSGICFDEYIGNPLPWDSARTRVWVQVR